MPQIIRDNEGRVVQIPTTDEEVLESQLPEKTTDFQHLTLEELKAIEECLAKEENNQGFWSQENREKRIALWKSKYQ